MKKENAIDRLQDLLLALSCVVDNLTIIQHTLAEGEVLPRVAADSVFAVKSHIARISDDLDHILTEVIK